MNRTARRFLQSMTGADEIIDTALQEDDDAPMFNDRGRTFLNPYDLTPEDAFNDMENPAASDVEAKLPPGEAEAEMEFMRPLDEDETEILDKTPFLDGLENVDDASTQQWLIERMTMRHSAMDKTLKDETYGESPMHLSGEERLERLGIDDESGRISRRSARPRTAPTTPVSTSKKYDPARDSKKAKVVKKLFAKLVREHANFLTVQDIKAGSPQKVRDEYETLAKAWATDQISRGGLPTSYTSGADPLVNSILGGDICGVWWNPLSYIFGRSQVVINNTKDQRVSDKDMPTSATPSTSTATPPPEVATTTTPAIESEAPPSDSGLSTAQKRNAYRRNAYLKWKRQQGSESIRGDESSRHL